jgi:hypothetical protein
MQNPKPQGHTAVTLRFCVILHDFVDHRAALTQLLPQSEPTASALIRDHFGRWLRQLCLSQGSVLLSIRAVWRFSSLFWHNFRQVGAKLRLMRHFSDLFVPIATGNAKFASRARFRRKKFSALRGKNNDNISW